MLINQVIKRIKKEKSKINLSVLYNMLNIYFVIELQLPIFIRGRSEGKQRRLRHHLSNVSLYSM